MHSNLITQAAQAAWLSDSSGTMMKYQKCDSWPTENYHCGDEDSIIIMHYCVELFRLEELHIVWEAPVEGA